MQIIGHRGASGYKPENTLAAFRQAIAMGVDMIELDVVALATGEVIVLHDATLNRTTNGSGPVENYTYSQLMTLNAGNGERIPLLTQVLELIDRRMPVNIELKGGQKTAAMVSDIITFYVNKRGWDDDLFIVSSFDHKTLRAFAALQPTIKLGVLYSDVPSRYWATNGKHTVYSANMDAAHITRDIVRDAHQRGMKVYAYTVNTKKRARELRAMLVDGIFTNYPDKMFSV